MNIQESYQTRFRYKNKFYEAIIKITTFINGYKIARVIINSEQYWVLFDHVSWKIMADQRKTGIFDKLMMNHLKK